ncbi:unnamed protein product [Oikopleura dioica]|uniref:Uncharacterized protein n=1 Tax=Oikopleura dioica TaxID=34765 RepID=E4XNQ2_OIKDI|nr:unnamed protein product [Oikopleura dioica]
MYQAMRCPAVPDFTKPTGSFRLKGTK